MALSSTKEVDFDIIQEDWTRFQLKPDQAVLRVRITVAKILETGVGELGVPDFGITAQNWLALFPAQELLKPVGEAPELNKPFSPDHIKEGTEIDFDLIGQPKWQEYKTKDGWIVMVRPEVGRVVKLKYYARIGQTNLMEPIYWANIQAVFRVRKA